jgi:hypothetical protein
MRRTILCIAVLALAATACETDTTNPEGIDTGFGTEDASGDVSLGGCSVDFKIVTCQLDIHKHQRRPQRLLHRGHDHGLIRDERGIG